MVWRQLLQFGLLSALFGAYAPQQDPGSVFRTPPAQRLDVPFRLFPTDNVWTQILLDSRDGRIWQVNWGEDAADSNSKSDKSVRCKIPINADSLIDAKSTSVGRFTLYPTYNMWTFILLDQFDGRTWQCQFSLDDQHRFCVPIVASELVLPPGTEQPADSKATGKK
jgi:hypothetical protein